MVILIDTNVILDYLISRKPFVDIANDVLDLCFQQKCSGYIATHSITNIFYILRKQFSVSERKNLLIATSTIPAILPKDFLEIIA